MAMSAGTQQPLAANSGPSEEAAAPQSPPFELADDFAGLVCGGGLMTIAGFGSLLSETSARSTFPELQNFRQGRLKGWRRVFTHQVGGEDAAPVSMTVFAIYTEALHFREPTSTLMRSIQQPPPLLPQST